MRDTFQMNLENFSLSWKEVLENINLIYRLDEPFIIKTDLNCKHFKYSLALFKHSCTPLVYVTWHSIFNPGSLLIQYLNN